MAEITLKGNPCNTTGDLPVAAATAPGFTLVAGDLSEKTMADFQGKNVILNIVPSFDTGTCALSVKTFNTKAGQLEDTVVVNISKDLPFAQKRFCAAEGVENVTNLSAFRCSEFENTYGVGLVDGPLKGLLTRAVVVVNKDGNVLHSELVGEIADEPNYDAALASIG
ncbi:thiol peroxidase [Mariniblastus sp.]|nr:thiol peroxidase [Mariniblastus sp.]MDC0284955.1 thiol peroxidase [Mariniblastus sp.]